MQKLEVFFVIKYICLLSIGCPMGRCRIHSFIHLSKQELLSIFDNISSMLK